jgi:hypothetical protein
MCIVKKNCLFFLAVMDFQMRVVTEMDFVPLFHLRRRKRVWFITLVSHMVEKKRYRLLPQLRATHYPSCCSSSLVCLSRAEGRDHPILLE